MPEPTAPGETSSPLRSTRPRWFDLLVRLDPVEAVLVVHGLALVTLGRVADPGWAAVIVLAFAVWRPALDLARSRAPQREPLLHLLKGAGSLALAMALMAADGGTESPFFFWPLLILAWQALVFPARSLGLLSGVALVAYLAVILGLPELTTASLARSFLLAAFCGVLVVGRLRLQHQQEHSEDLQQLLAEAFWHAPVGLAVLGPDADRIHHTNEMARVLGLTDEVGWEEDGALGKLAERARETGEPAGPELLVLRTGDDTSYLRVMVAPYVLGGGQTVLIVCAEDVTPQVTMGEERRRFLEVASHQLRTPLTPIVAYAQLLARRELDQETTVEATEAILKGALRLERLFDRMAAVVRLQNEAPRELTELTVGELIEQHLRPLAPDLADFVELEGDLDVRIRCHPTSVARALFELLDNSRRFGTLPARMRWEPNGAKVVIRVHDAGGGPDLQDDPGRLFTDWGQALPSDVMPRGMGTRLGLMQAHLLAGLSSGSLRFEREDGAWAFVLTLPGIRRDVRASADR